MWTIITLLTIGYGIDVIILHRMAHPIQYMDETHIWCTVYILLGSNTLSDFLYTTH